MRECVVSRREVKTDHKTLFEVTTTTRSTNTKNNNNAQDQKVVKESKNNKKTEIQGEIIDTDVETWYVFYSDKHQREYYFEPKSGTTQWHMPQIIFPSSEGERRSGSQQDAFTVNLTNTNKENKVKKRRSRTIQFRTKTLETRGSGTQIMRKLKVSKNIRILFMIFCTQVVLIVVIMIQVRKQRGLNNISTNKDNSSSSIIIQSQNNITNINTTSFINSTFSSTTITRNLYTSNNSTEDINNRISPFATNNENPTEIGFGQDNVDTSEMGIINTMDHRGMFLFPSEDGEITTSQTIELSSSSTISVSKTDSHVTKSSATNTKLNSVMIATKTYTPKNNNNKDKQRLFGQANEISGENCLKINNKEKDKRRKKTYDQVIKRRWSYCDLPFLYIFQRCRRFHSREPILFDLSEIIQSMMQ